MTISFGEQEMAVRLSVLCALSATYAATCTCTLALLAIPQTQPRRRTPRIIHPEGIAATRLFFTSLLYGSSIRFEALFRMNQPTFRRLISWLREHTGLEDTRSISAEGQVMMTLYILAQSATQRSTAYLFKISQSTVSRVVRRVLKKLVKLHNAFVCQAPADFVDPLIVLNEYTTAFNGCIGAIDGTHIPAFVPKDKQDAWRDRNGQYTQNVLAAVNFDYEFVYVLAGSEGSYHDQRVLGHALGTVFTIPEGRYYLGDSGFSPRPGIVVPYPNTRYHLKEWQESKKKPNTKEELYNLRHSHCRVTVENVFGRCKRQWAILRGGAPEYRMKDQVRIVYAATGLYNFILKTNKSARMLQDEEEEVLREAKMRADNVVRARHGNEIRGLVADSLWSNYPRRQQV